MSENENSEIKNKYDMNTYIYVSKETREFLNEMKEKKDTTDDVIKRMIEHYIPAKKEIKLLLNIIKLKSDDASQERDLEKAFKMISEQQNNCINILESNLKKEFKIEI